MHYSAPRRRADAAPGHPFLFNRSGGAAGSFDCHPERSEGSKVFVIHTVPLTMDFRFLTPFEMTVETGPSENRKTLGGRALFDERPLCAGGVKKDYDVVPVVVDLVDEHGLGQVPEGAGLAIRGYNPRLVGDEQPYSRPYWSDY